MLNLKTMAIIVMYYPTPDDIQNIQEVAKSVNLCVVVNNGPDNIFNIKLYCDRLKAIFLQMDNKNGIAGAINAGMEIALQRNVEWVFVFDQDSRNNASVINGLVEYVSYAQRDSMAICVPYYYIDRRTNEKIKSFYEKNGKILLSQTSGSAINVSAYKNIGKFLESFSVDYVDYEYCLRAVSRGYTINACDKENLHHNPASISIIRLFGVISIKLTNYCAQRRYYQTRNCIWISKIYFTKHSFVCARMLIKCAIDTAKIVFENDRKLKICFAMRGFYDGIVNSSKDENSVFKD